METEVDLIEGTEAYAFVDAAPPLYAPGARRDILFDAVRTSGFDNGNGGTPESLYLVRLMSTQERLRALFQLADFAEGQWYRLKLRKQPACR